MNQVRTLVFYKNYFYDFFDKQSEKANKLMKEYFSTTKQKSNGKERK